MATANRELSKQLQELSGWHEPGRDAGRYSLDYLLAKIKETPDLIGLTLTDEGYYTWRVVASVNRVHHSATEKTPADAACSLLIKLFEAGILK